MNTQLLSVKWTYNQLYCDSNIIGTCFFFNMYVKHAVYAVYGGDL